nr:hypothetical protein [Albimonas donghaensis]
MEQVIPFGPKAFNLGPDQRIVDAIGKSIYQSFQLDVDLRKALSLRDSPARPFLSNPGDLSLKLGHELPDDIDVEQAGLETAEDPLFDLLSWDRFAVLAGPGSAVTGAAIATAAGDRHRPAAEPAGYQTRQGVGLSVRPVQCVPVAVFGHLQGDHLLAGLHRLPEIVWDDP